MIYNGTFQEYLRSLPVQKRVSELRKYGYKVELRRFRKGDRSFKLFSSYKVPSKKEIRIAISAPHGRFFYCYCVILGCVVV